MKQASFLSTDEVKQQLNEIVHSKQQSSVVTKPGSPKARIQLGISHDSNISAKRQSLKVNSVFIETEEGEKSQALLRKSKTLVREELSIEKEESFVFRSNSPSLSKDVRKSVDSYIS